MKTGSEHKYLDKVRHWFRLDELSPKVRVVLVSIVGGCVCLAGIAMIILPGPAFVVIPLGVAILALEFQWARHALDKIKGWMHRIRRRVRAARSRG